MADLSAYIGNTQLQHIVIPGSHDTGTYGFTGPNWTYGGAQNVDLKTQLTHGVRYIDVRANYHDGNYYIYHGLIDKDTGLTLGQLLNDLTDWANTPGHEREIILAHISASQDSADTRSPSQFNQLCQSFAHNAGSALLLGSTRSTAKLGSIPVYSLTPNQLASLPGQPRIITDWSACDSAAGDTVGLASFPGYYANECYQDDDPINAGVTSLDKSALQGRYKVDAEGPSSGNTADPMGSAVPSGFYTLSAARTTTGNCLVPLWFLGDESKTFDAVKSWYMVNDGNARTNLNILYADFVQTNPVVEDAVMFNQVPPLAPASAYTPMKVNLKTVDGHFLGAVNSGGLNTSGIVHTDATTLGAWETFWVQWLDDAHTKLALKTETGNYMTATNGGGIGKPWGWINDAPLHTDANSAGAWEAFTLNVNSNSGSANLQAATLQTPDGHYVSPVNGGGIGENGRNTEPIHMDATSIGPDEQFSLVKR